MDTLYWIVEYDKKGIIPEYNPETGERISWKDIPKKGIKSIMWIPLNEQLLRKIKHPMPDTRVSLSFLPMFKCNIPEDAIPIPPFRTQEIKVMKRWKCKLCGKEFKDSECEHYKRKFKNFQVPICPNCKSSDVFICEHCGYKTIDTEGRLKCPRCGKDLFWEFQQNIFRVNKEERHTKYHLGYIKDERKFEIIIDEFGNVELN